MLMSSSGSRGGLKEAGHELHRQKHDAKLTKACGIQTSVPLDTEVWRRRSCAR